MTKSAVSSILKNIKMNPFASSGDEGRSRSYSTIPSRDAERYGRSRTVDSSLRSMDRYEREQFELSQLRDVARDGRYRSSGSLDRHYQIRIPVDDHYGRRYVDDRFMVPDVMSSVDRMSMPREFSRDAARRDEFNQGMYGYVDRHVKDRYDQGYGLPSYDRQRYGYDYQPYDRYGYGRGYGNDRMRYDSRYGVDRSHFEDRMTQDRIEQSGKVHFDGDRQSRTYERRRSSSIARDDLLRRESRNPEDYRRARSLPPRQAEEAYYLQGSIAKEDKTSGVTIPTEKLIASRTRTAKYDEEHSKKTSVMDDQARDESQSRQVSQPRRESDHEMQSELEKSEIRTIEDRTIEFEDREKQPLSRRESEGRQQQLSRRESELRQQELSRRESETQQEQLSRRESEGRQQPLSRRESELRQQELSRRESETQQEQLSRRESELRQQPLSRRESELRQQELSRRESETQQEQLSRRESELRQQPLSRRESELRQQELSRRESETQQEQLSRRESEGRQQPLSRRESELRQQELSRRESETQQQQLSRRESEVRQQQLSRRESEARQQSLSRRESEGRQQALSRRESEGRELSRRESEGRELSRRESEGRELSRRESEGRELSRHESEGRELSRRESEGRELSRRESEGRELSRRESEGRELSRRESEGREQALSRRESKGREQALSRRESEGRQQALSRRESEGRQQSLSRRESETQQQQLSRRESEAREQSLSRRESEGREQSLSGRESETKQQSLSRRESEGRQQSLSRRESEGRQQTLSRRESEAQEKALSRRESEGRQQSLSRRESEAQEKALSRRESEAQEKALSRRESEGRQQSLSRRESEGRQQSEGMEPSMPIADHEAQQESLSRRDSEVQEKPLSRRESGSRQQTLSRRESEGQEQSLSRRESEKHEHVSSRRESDVEEKSLSRRESESGQLPRPQSEERKVSLSRRDSNEAEKLLSPRHESSRRASEKENRSGSRKSSAVAEVPLDDDVQDITLVVPTGIRSRSQSRSQHGSERGDGEQEVHQNRVEFAETCEQEGDQQPKRQVRRNVQFGSQFGSDRMPAPIPPYSEPRSTYPTTKDHTTRADDRSTVRSREYAVRATYDIMRRRYYERSVDPSLNPTWLERGGTADSSQNVSHVSEDVLRIEDIDFRCKENAELHETSKYELVRDVEQPNPVFRRGKTFIMDITFKDRAFEDSQDNVHVNFYFGPNPSVPKRTRVVLPLRLNAEFQRVPHQWDARVISQEKNTLSVEVSMPVSCPVGMWRCVVDTCTIEDPSSRLQYRSDQDVYVIFNPFSKDDVVYMEDEERRHEFVLNESGKIYTGGYRNVNGRPWIYGQFDDCVLPAVCVLLEMSGLSYAERGNAVKVTKALTSMIKSGRFDKQTGKSDCCSNGLIEVKYEDSYCGGNSPHLWSGSVQIIEEFLRRGATPVKYGQCWVMTGLMTTLCRALGLPARPVTAFVSAVDTQDTLTVDRFVDRFGDIQEDPACDQPDSLWSFRTWCDVWMHRADQIPEYSGWQATDPCRTFRDKNGVVKGSCGPCPVEALRRADVGQRDDVDAFFSSMNAYVRYFYEDEESGWGYSPFRQFKYPVSRYVLTKSVGKFDDKGDDDCEDLTSMYRNDDQTEEQRFSTFNSCRGLKDLPSFEYQAAAHNWMNFDPKGNDNKKFDVKFELENPERVMIGQAFTIPVIVTNNSANPRTMQTNICTRSSFYTGSLGSYLKRSSTQLKLEPEQSQTIYLTLDPKDYENKLLGMAYVKITVTGFVQETGQSFIDELDFCFNKPCLKIETSDMKAGGETEAEFSFTNPLDVALTDCLLTMEVSGSVRPRTIRLNRDVPARESFTLTHSFVTRSAGERHMVACFASRQLSDVVGHRSVMVHE